MARKSSETVLLNFDFDPKNYIVIDLLFNFKKTSEEKIVERIIEKLPDDNDNLYIEHREGTNLFKTTCNKKQKEKDDLFKILTNLDKKIVKSKDKKKIRQVRGIKKQTKRDYEKLGESNVDTDLDRRDRCVGNFSIKMYVNGNEVNVQRTWW